MLRNCADCGGRTIMSFEDVIMNKYLDFFLEQRMDSVDSEEIKDVLEAISDEEKKWLELRD